MDENTDRSVEQFFTPGRAVSPPRALSGLLGQAGVQFNGEARWDIRVHNPRLYTNILSRGSLGFGESYVAGDWDCTALDELFERLLSVDIDERLGGWARLRLFGEVLCHRLFNLQSRQRAFRVAEQHYDIGNDIFEIMLDSSMSYSCGFWQSADSLEQAQLDKLEMICQKLELKRGESLLEIGCGWGGLARYAADRYGVSVVGITVSKEQQKLAQERCQGWPIDIRLMDYRDVQGRFDKLVSVGMFEHVGLKNYPAYFDAVSRLMKPDGLFLLHTIGNYKSTAGVDPWIERHIFPNGKLPSAQQLASALNDRLLIEDWHNFGQDYDLTLQAWWERFDAAWPRLERSYDRHFYRMWKYYLMSCAGFFRSRQGQLWQLVLSKRDRKKVYRSMRPGTR